VRFARIFATGIAVLLLLLVNFAPVYAATKPHAHGCAQPVPPLMSGSPGLPPATPGVILINEVLNNPHSIWNCSESAGTSSVATDSWVELYNPQNQPFNLYEARASLDSGSINNAYHFPFGSAIAAHSYLVVFPENYSLISSFLQTNNPIRLLFGGVTVIDQVSVPTVPADTSYARIPDGSASWQITTNPTIDASNLSSTQATATPVTTKGSGYSGSGSGYSGSGYATPTLVTGKQPGWSKLQLPAANSSTAPGTANPLVASPAPSTTTNAWDAPRRILLTVLVVGLALSLLWCWKLFTAH